MSTPEVYGRCGAVRAMLGEPDLSDQFITDVALSSNYAADTHPFLVADAVRESLARDGRM